MGFFSYGPNELQYEQEEAKWPTEQHSIAFK
jgi:hypothetical protein